METSPKEMVPDPSECGGMIVLLLYGVSWIDLTVARASGGFKSLTGDARASIGSGRARPARRGEPALRDSEARRPAPSLRLAARNGRRAQELGGAEGPIDAARGAAA